MATVESSLENPVELASGATADGVESRRHWAMFGFVALSLLVTMSVGQTEGFQRGSLQYWLVILPAVTLPMLDLRAIVGTLLERARLLLWFLLGACIWHFFKGDIWTTAQLYTLVLGMTWISTSRAQISIGDLTRLYFVLVMIGLLVLLFLDFNQYGVVPGFSHPDFGIWRVSFYPNIAYTGALSFVMVLVLTRTKAGVRRHPIVFAIASYFLVLSFVRAALIALLIYAVLYWYFCKDPEVQSRRMFWISLLVAFGLPLAVFWSADLLYWLQDSILISTFLLRGKAELSVEDILYQLYRPWLWATHLHLFLSSPAWMGWGSLYQSMLDAAGPPQVTTGSESLPTRLLATYGIPGIFFTFYLVRLLRELAQAGDRWACACFPAIFFLLLNWGGFFHPADAMFVLLLLFVTRGADGFTCRDDQGSSTETQSCLTPEVSRSGYP